MNRKVIKPVVLSGLFLAALIVFSIITNQDNKDMTTAMKEATLPIVQFYEKSEALLMKSGVLMIPGWLQREMHRRSKKKIMKSLQT